jgi:molybdopterin converting factor small subunit
MEDRNMPVLKVPSLMRYYVKNQMEVHLRGDTVGALIADLLETYPDIRAHLVDKHGNLRRYINLFVNQDNIRDLNGLDTTLREDDQVVLLPSISGGHGHLCPLIK